MRLFQHGGILLGSHVTLHPHDEFQTCGKVVIFEVCAVEILESVRRVEEWHTLQGKVNQNMK